MGVKNIETDLSAPRRRVSSTSQAGERARKSSSARFPGLRRWLPREKERTGVDGMEMSVCERASARSAIYERDMTARARGRRDDYGGHGERQSDENAETEATWMRREARGTKEGRERKETAKRKRRRARKGENRQDRARRNTRRLGERDETSRRRREQVLHSFRLQTNGPSQLKSRAFCCPLSSLHLRIDPSFARIVTGRSARFFAPSCSTCMQMQRPARR